MKNVSVNFCSNFKNAALKGYFFTKNSSTIKRNITKTFNLDLFRLFDSFLQLELKFFRDNLKTLTSNLTARTKIESFEKMRETEKKNFQR